MSDPSALSFWRYAPRGVLTRDGVWQVTGRDRYSYFLRHKGEVAIVPCEHYQAASGSGIEVALPPRLEFRHHDGARLAAAEEMQIIKEVLDAGLRALDTAVVTFA